MAAYSRNRTDDMRTKTLYKADGDRLKIDRFPCFHITGSIAGMKRMFYGRMPCWYVVEVGFTTCRKNRGFII